MRRWKKVNAKMCEYSVWFMFGKISFRFAVRFIYIYSVKKFYEFIYIFIARRTYKKIILIIPDGVCICYNKISDFFLLYST